MHLKKSISFLILFSITSFVQSQIKVLIVDGQNNHDVWPKSTIMMKQYLEETGLFSVEIARSNYLWKSQREKSFLPLAGVEEKETSENPKTDPKFCPKFNKYDVVISNFGWKAADWPVKTQKSFEKFVQKGGGFVSVHAADNSFPTWKGYNEMIGLGGWGDRNEKDGPYVYYSNEGKLIVDPSAGSCGAHGPQNELPITIRVTDHPITKGMPLNWLTGKDECYAKLRGPALNMTILATAKDPSSKPPTNRHEPILMVVNYGKGRIFHTTLGHDDYSFENVGFIVSLLRGTEWAATGKVSQDIPKDFPTSTAATSRTFKLKN